MKFVKRPDRDRFAVVFACLSFPRAYQIAFSSGEDVDRQRCCGSVMRANFDVAAQESAIDVVDGARSRRRIAVR